MFTIKTPVTLPYYTNSLQFETVNGAIEMDGIEYEYIKRRIYNDSIELVCLPNVEKQNLESARDQFVRLSNDWQSSESNEKLPAGVVKILLPEYCESPDILLFQPPVTLAKNNFSAQVFILSSGFLSLPEWPPSSLLHC